MNNQQLFQALLSNPSPDALAEYARTDMVVLRCPDNHGFAWEATNLIFQPIGNICKLCGLECDRLLITGQWQSAEEQRRENLTQV